MRIRDTSISEFLKPVTASLCLFSLSCASVESENESQQISEFDESAFWEEAYREWRQDALIAFGEPGAALNEGDRASEFTDYFRVMVLPSFREPILVSVRRDQYPNEQVLDDGIVEEPLSYIYVKTFDDFEIVSPPDAGIFIQDGGYAVPEKTNVVVRGKSSRTSLTARIADEQFLSLREQFGVINKANYPIAEKNGPGCTDGTTYFIESVVSGHRAWFARHSCDEKFSKDFAFASPVMLLAASIFEEKTRILRSYNDQIRNNTINSVVEDEGDKS